jgi:hypothetical protein
MQRQQRMTQSPIEIATNQLSLRMEENMNKKSACK